MRALNVCQFTEFALVHTWLQRSRLEPTHQIHPLFIVRYTHVNRDIAFMTEEEIEQLRHSLSKVVDKMERDHPVKIVDDMIWLNEDHSVGRVTVAELTVFRIDRAYLDRLNVAHSAYEFLIDIVDYDGFFDRPTIELIYKARSICPPSKTWDTEIPFRLHHDCQQWFSWFSKAFLDIPDRQSYGWYYKHSFNTIGLVRFEED